MCLTYFITSGKGGVGKSTLSVLLSLSLGNKNKKVLIIDADLGLNNINILLQIEKKTRYDLEDVLKGRTTIENVLQKVNANIDLLTFSTKQNINYFNDTFLNEIINYFKNKYDFIIIDSPSGIENGFIKCIPYFDLGIIVTNIDKTSIHDGKKVVNLLKQKKKKNLFLVVNEFSYRGNKKRILLNEIMMNFPNMKVITIEKMKKINNLYQKRLFKNIKELVNIGVSRIQVGL